MTSQTLLSPPSNQNTFVIIDLECDLCQNVVHFVNSLLNFVGDKLGKLMCVDPTITRRNKNMKNMVYRTPRCRPKSPVEHVLLFERCTFKCRMLSTPNIVTP